MENSKLSSWRIHYGWVVVAGAFLATAVSGGLFYSFGVFFQPLQEEFGWTRATTASINTVWLISFAISGYFMGWLTDVRGPRFAMLLGAVLTGAGFVMTSRADSLGHFYLTYALTGIGTAATWSPPLAVVQRWFERKRGLTLGIVASGVGAGTMVLSPLLSWFITSYGWREAYIGLGVLCFVALTLSALVLIQSPLEKGMLPYGAAPQRMTAAIHNSENQQGEAPADKEHWRIGAAVRTKAFYCIWGIYVLSLVPPYVLSAHIVRFATDRGVTALAAASALGAFGIGGTIARVGGGALSDVLGWTKGIALFSFLTAVPVFVLVLIGTPGAAVIFVIMLALGVFSGARVPLIPGLLGCYFGTDYLARLIAITHGLAVIFASGSPALAGFIFDRTGSYAIPFYLAGFCAVGAGILALLTHPPRVIGAIQTEAEENAKELAKHVKARL